MAAIARQDGYSGGPVFRKHVVVGLMFGQRANMGAALPVSAIKVYLRGNVDWNRSLASCFEEVKLSS
jgi:hypothetical protein